MQGHLGQRKQSIFKYIKNSQHKQKNNKWDFIKLKTDYKEKQAINRMKAQPQEWENTGKLFIKQEIQNM